MGDDKTDPATTKAATGYGGPRITNGDDADFAREIETEDASEASEATAEESKIEQLEHEVSALATEVEELQQRLDDLER